MPTPIVFEAGKVAFEGKLNDSPTAQLLAQRLPLTLRMSRWGEEYYGDIGTKLGAEEAADARDDMKVGELAYWIPGNALCIFFGPTPASTGDAPKAASPVNPVGSLQGDLTALKGLGRSAQVTVKKKA
jgi:uncharacterized protein